MFWAKVKFKISSLIEKLSLSTSWKKLTHFIHKIVETNVNKTLQLTSTIPGTFK